MDRMIHEIESYLLDSIQTHSMIGCEEDDFSAAYMSLHYGHDIVLAFQLIDRQLDILQSIKDGELSTQQNILLERLSVYMGYLIDELSSNIVEFAEGGAVPHVLH